MSRFLEQIQEAVDHDSLIVVLNEMRAIESWIDIKEFEKSVVDLPDGSRMKKTDLAWEFVRISHKSVKSKYEEMLDRYMKEIIGITFVPDQV